MYSILNSLKHLQRWLIGYPEEPSKEIAPLPPLEEKPQSKRNLSPEGLSESEWYSWNLLTSKLPSQVVRHVFKYIKPELVEHVTLPRRSEREPQAAYTIPTLFVERVSSFPNQPSLIFTIGPPGIGKTAWANANLNDIQIITLDDFFKVYCGGVFDHTRVREAYEWCFDQTVKLLDSGQSAVVNNTNTRISSMYQYITYLLFRRLPHKVVFALFPCTQDDFWKLRRRSARKVSRKKMNLMIRNVERMSKPCIKDVLSRGPYRPWRKWTDCIYLGIFLTPKSKAKLNSWLANKIKLLPDKPEHLHTTLVFRPSKSEIDRFLPSLRKRVTMRILGLATSKLVQAVYTEILDKDLSQLCNNKFPHITISTQPWIKPVTSNALLEFGKRLTPPSKELLVEGFCDARMKNGWMSEYIPRYSHFKLSQVLSDTLMATSKVVTDNIVSTSGLKGPSSTMRKAPEDAASSTFFSLNGNSLKRRIGSRHDPIFKRQRT